MYYIKISGYIPQKKVNEFKMTANACFASWKHRCVDLNFSKDLIYSDLCHYQSTWKDLDTYLDFLKSEDLKILEGCFRVLGSLSKVSHGEMISDEEKDKKQ